MSQSATIVQRLWNYCNVLRDDGLSYGDYVEQLTYLLFLKMADEQTKPPYNRRSVVPAKYSWDSLVKLDGEALDRAAARAWMGRVMDGEVPRRMLRRISALKCWMSTSRYLRTLELPAMAAIRESVTREGKA